MKFYKTIDQKKKYLENENISERTLKIGLRRDQHFYRSNATKKKTVINETKLLKTLTRGSTE